MDATSTLLFFLCVKDVTRLLAAFGGNSHHLQHGISFLLHLGFTARRYAAEKVVLDA